MANKKVSQLTSKPSVLVTDLFPIADPSTGQLYKTTISDLGTAIGSGVSSVNSLVGAVVLDTDDIQELVSPTNKWFTDTRARAAISAGTGISYNSGTGVITNAVTSGQIATALGYTPANGANYLPIVGGTMLGAIFGTIATFESSTSVTALGITLSGSTGDGIKITHSAGRAFNIQSSGSGYGVLINNTTASTSAPFTIQKQGANKITFSDLGAGIFASGLTAETLDLSNTTASNSLRINHTNTSYHAVSITATGGSALYATGSVTVVGSLTTTGVLTAQAGLANGSGQSFALPSTTGTLALTSQLSSYLPLSGGTLTGALSGTSATFSSTITSSRNDTGNISMTLSNAYINQGNLINFVHNSGGSTTNGYIGHGGDSSGNIVIINNGITALSLARATGAATFTNSVLVKKNGSDSANDALALVNAAGDRYFNWQLDSSGNLAGWRYSGSSFNQWLSVNYSSGNVGIGTTAPATAGGAYVGLNVAGANGASLVLTYGTNNHTYLYNSSSSDFSIENAGAQIFRAGSSERMRITSDGKLLVGQTTSTLSSNGWHLDGVNGGGHTAFAINNNEAFIFNNRNTGTNYKVDFRTNTVSRGNINVTDSLVSYNTTSDYRLKQDLKPINGLELVNKIKVYDYEWIEDKTRMDGVLAHELQEILPYAVTGVKDGEQMQSVDYSKIVPVLIQAIKDQQVQIEQLKNK